jgi:ParB family transcriptional regulator, chromosome partitioning protein
VIADPVLTRPISALRPHPDNPRGTLTEADVADLVPSIREHGVLQPLVVTPDGTVLVGHRRLLAARLADQREVPVIVREAPSRIEQIAILLTENLTRQDFTPIQEARAYRTLLDCGLSRAEVCRLVGVGIGRLADRLALLTLPSLAIAAVERGDLSIGAGVAIASVKDAGRQRELATTAMATRLPCAKVTDLVARAKRGRPAAAPEQPRRQGVPIATAAIESLRKHPDRHVTFGELSTIVRNACGRCGLIGHDVNCRECQVPWIVNQMAAR